MERKPIEEMKNTASDIQQKSHVVSPVGYNLNHNHNQKDTQHSKGTPPCTYFSCSPFLPIRGDRVHDQISTVLSALVHAPLEQV